MSIIHAVDSPRRGQTRLASRRSGRASSDGFPSAELAERRAWRVARSALAALTIGIAAASATIPGAAAATPTPSSQPSAIGDESPSWIQVAPNYQRTGLVVAVASPKTSCQTSCAHLWVSRDGGSTWHRVPATGWDGGRPVIAVDARGHDVLYSGSSSSLLRSDDAGATWTAVGTNGTPAVSSTYATDGGAIAVAVAQGGDYILHDSGQTTASGSGGTLFDMSYAYAPSFPSAGRYAPVLLTAEDKNQRLPVIQQCTASYVCSGSTTLSGAVYFSSPVTLLPSSDYANDGTVFAQSGRGIYKSTDGAVSFTPIPLGDPSATATATPMLALAPGYKEQSSVKTAWAAVFQIFQNKTDPKQSHAGGGLFRTDDGGGSWHAVATPGPFDGGAVAVAAAPDGRLFGGYVGGTASNAGLVCSTDGGNTWRAACSPEGNAANDPGPLSGSVHPCSTCVPKTGGAAGGAAANSGVSAGGTNGSASATGSPNANVTGKAPSTEPVRAASAKTNTTKWPWVLLLVVLAVLLALLGSARLVTRRRRANAATD